jgi:hypothetical protein
MLGRLLPEIEIQRLRYEFYARAAIIVLVAVSFVFIVLGILLIPSSILSSSRIKAVENRFNDISKKTSQYNGGAAEAALTRTSALMSIIHKDPRSLSVTEVVEMILANRGRQVTIESLSISSPSGKNNKTTIGLSGKAISREALVTFVKRLDSEGVFEPLSVPVSNFTKSRDIDFSISAVIRQPTDKVQQ